MQKVLKHISKWKTSKKMLVAWFIFMLIYVLVDTIYTLCSGNYLDATLTASLFDAMKWSCGSSGLIGVADKGVEIADIIKGSSDDEGGKG